LDSIELLSCMAKETDKVEKRKNCLEICTPNRTFFLSATNPEEMHQWISAIQLASESFLLHSADDLAANRGSVALEKSNRY